MSLIDFRKIDAADVYRQSFLVGQIKRTDDGTEFAFTQEFLSNKPLGDQGVSWTMPQTKWPYFGSGESLPPFFANLAPEGARLAATIGRLHTSPDDLMSVLLAVGADCIGDIQVVPEGVGLPEQTVLKKTEPSDVDLMELFNEAVSGEDLEASALPGVQEKISNNVVNFPSRFGFGNRPTLIKINPVKFPFLIENENYFLEVAKNAGLDVNEAKIISDKKGRSGLIVRRFDRCHHEKKLVRLHQEDACQLLERYPWQKYRITMNEVAAAFDKFVTSGRKETLQLLRLYCFSYLIGNADLHAKNISLYERDGIVELTPGYDLLSTLPYSDLDTHMAMSLNGRDDNFKPDDFVSFGERWEVPPEATKKMTREVFSAVSDSVSSLEAIGMDEKATKRTRRIIQERLQKFSRNFG